MITSAGCDWYIRWLLAAAGVDVEIHANPGRFEAGQGFADGDADVESAYWSPTLGVDKARSSAASGLTEGQTVAFMPATRLPPTQEAARLVPMAGPSLRPRRSGRHAAKRKLVRFIGHLKHGPTICPTPCLGEVPDMLRPTQITDPDVGPRQGRSGSIGSALSRPWQSPRFVAVLVSKGLPAAGGSTHGPAA